MEDHVKSALEIVKAQASVRAMSAEEIVSMAQSVAKAIAAEMVLSSGVDIPEVGAPAGNGKASIKETSILCLECGKKFKVITKKHLAVHGMTPADYRAKHGLKKGMALACKSLTRARRAKMKDMALWTRKGAAKTEAVQ